MAPGSVRIGGLVVWIGVEALVRVVYLLPGLLYI
jgi:hypothetical protein